MWRVCYWFSLINRCANCRDWLNLIHLLVLKNLWSWRRPCFGLFYLRVLFCNKFTNLNAWCHLNISYNFRSVFVFTLYCHYSWKFWNLWTQKLYLVFSLMRRLIRTFGIKLRCGLWTWLLTRNSNKFIKKKTWILIRLFRLTWKLLFFRLW